MLGAEGSGPKHDRVVGREDQRKGVGEPVSEGRDASVERVADERIGGRFRKTQAESEVQLRVGD